MGRLYISYLEGRVYSCKCCKAHLANIDELVSKVGIYVFATLTVHARRECRSLPYPSVTNSSCLLVLFFRPGRRVNHELKSCERYAGALQSFHCRNGKAYLFNTVVNIETGTRHVDLFIFAYALLG